MITALQSINIVDAGQIALLSNQLGYQTDAKDSLERIEHLISNQDHQIFIAKNESQIIGWIHAFYSIRVESTAFVEIAGLVVHDQHRGQNIGKNLIEAVKEWSLKFNVDRICVRCNVVRTESHRFYEQVGFHLHKQQKIFELTIAIS